MHLYEEGRVNDAIFELISIAENLDDCDLTLDINQDNSPNLTYNNFNTH